jgi:hypothetical protein
MMSGNNGDNGKESGYEVGYGKPPVAHQFKPGNKRGGRPKGSVSLRQKLREMLKDSDAADVIRALMDGAKQGEIKKIREMFIQVDGKVPQQVIGRIDHTHRLEVLMDKMRERDVAIDVVADELGMST